MTDLNRDIHIDVIVDMLTARIAGLESDYRRAAQHAANVRADLQPIPSQWAVEDVARDLRERLDELRAALEWVEAQRKTDAG